MYILASVIFSDRSAYKLKGLELRKLRAQNIITETRLPQKASFRSYGVYLHVAAFVTLGLLQLMRFQGFVHMMQTLSTHINAKSLLN